MNFTFTDTNEATGFKHFELLDGTESIAYVTRDWRMFYRGKEITSEAEFIALVPQFTGKPFAAPERAKD